MENIGEKERSTNEAGIKNNIFQYPLYHAYKSNLLVKSLCFIIMRTPNILQSSRPWPTRNGKQKQMPKKKSMEETTSC